jgi:hypothetical protein
VVYFKVLFQLLPGATEENNFRQDSRCPGREWNCMSKARIIYLWLIYRRCRQLRPGQHSVQWQQLALLLLRSQETPGSYFGPETSQSDWEFPLFCTILRSKCRGKTLHCVTTAFLRTLFNSFVLSVQARAANSVVKIKQVNTKQPELKNVNSWNGVIQTYIYIYIYKICPATRQGGAWVERRYSSYSFLTSALERGAWSASRPGRAFTPGERAPGTRCTWGWVGPRVGLAAETREKTLCLCRVSNPGRPGSSQSLYWLSYPAHEHIYSLLK